MEEQRNSLFSKVCNVLKGTTPFCIELDDSDPYIIDLPDKKED